MVPRHRGARRAGVKSVEGRSAINNDVATNNVCTFLEIGKMRLKPAGFERLPASLAPAYLWPKFVSWTR